MFDAFNQRPIPVADLVAMMDRTGAERHLLMWSDDPAQQAAWEELGLSGVLPEDGLMLSLLNRVSVKGMDPVKAALCQNLTIVLCLMPFSWPQLHEVKAMDWLWIALLGVFCTGLAHSLFVASLKVLKARTTAVIFALEPVYGIAFAWWLFDEQPGLRMLAGGALITSAIALSARKGAAAQERPATAQA